MTNNSSRPPDSVDEKIRSGYFDDILARIDAAYANYKQTPVFTCQEEELAYWSRMTPADTENPTSQPDEQPQP